jgi:hypothetical protein
MHVVGWLGVGMLVAWGALLFGLRVAGRPWDLLLVVGVFLIIWGVTRGPRYE